MKQSILSFALFGVLSSAGLPQDKGGKVDWERNPQEAMEKAKAAGKGMMLYFTSAG